MRKLHITHVEPQVGGSIATIGRAMDALNAIATDSILSLSDGRGVSLIGNLAGQIIIPRGRVLRTLAGLIVDHPHNSVANRPGADRKIPRFVKHGDLSEFLLRIGSGTDKLSDVQLGEVVVEFWERLESMDPNLVAELDDSYQDIDSNGLIALVAAYLIPRAEGDAASTGSVPIVESIRGLDTDDVGVLTGGDFPEVEPDHGASMLEGRAGRTGGMKVIPIPDEESADETGDRGEFAPIEERLGGEDDVSMVQGTTGGGVPAVQGGDESGFFEGFNEGDGKDGEGADEVV